MEELRAALSKDNTLEPGEIEDIIKEVDKNQVQKMQYFGSFV